MVFIRHDRRKIKLVRYSCQLAGAIKVHCSAFFLSHPTFPCTAKESR